MKYNYVDWLASILVVVGAINWGLVGFFQFNLVDTIFGEASTLSRIVYSLVGIAGLWMIYSLTKISGQTQMPQKEERERIKRAA